MLLKFLQQKGERMFISSSKSQECFSRASVFRFNFLWVKGRILLMHAEAQKLIKQEEEDSSAVLSKTRNECPDLN